MKQNLTRSALAALLLVPSILVGASVPSAQEPAPEASGDSDDGVACRVDGHAITEEDIERSFLGRVARRTGGRIMRPDQLAGLRDSFRSSIIEELIDNYLLDQDVTRAEVAMTEEEFLSILKRGLNARLLRSGLTRADFEGRLQSEQGISLDELLEQQASDPELRRAALQSRLLETTYPEDFKVTEEQIEARYQNDLASVYTTPAQVRASHILIGTDGMDDEARAAARAQAEGLRTQCLEPEADFAALARRHSTGPSRLEGGDLGFFPREGAMVEPFAAAAFALEVGRISEVVETRFGYHIIQVTERDEARVISREEAAGTIREELRVEKLATVRKRHAEKLRAAAEIVYA